MYNYSAKVIKVINGDTVELLINLGRNIFIKETIRLYGINAPEKKGLTHEAGVKSMMYLDKILSTIIGGKIYIQTIKDQNDKYGRLLGILHYSEFYNSFENSINQQMITDGYAIAAPASWK